MRLGIVGALFTEMVKRCYCCYFVVVVVVVNVWAFIDDIIKVAVLLKTLEVLLLRSDDNKVCKKVGFAMLHTRLEKV